MTASTRKGATDAIALGEAIGRGDITAAEAMEAALAAAQECAQFGALARIEPEMGRRDAVAVEALQADRNVPFRGVPFLAKDLGSHAAGLAPCAGSPMLRRRAVDPSTDSDLFSRFRAAGLVPFGLTTVPEFGLALTSEPPGGPTARNPWDPGRSPGGSSGGAAAAVAAGIVAIAHATDAAGSIRVPAACCGLVGLKPSRGATPEGPDFNNHLMGIVGELVLARSVRDVAAAYGAVAGHACGPCADAAPRELPEASRLALFVPAGTEAEQATAAREAAAKLAEAGCQLSESDPAALAVLGERAARIVRLILSAGLADWLDGIPAGPGDVSPLAAGIAEEGRRLSASRLFAAGRELARVAYEMHILFEHVDAILSPVLAGSAPPIGHFDLSRSDPDGHFAAMNALAPAAALANVAGTPALVLPFGTDRSGMPLAVQIVGPIGSDEAVLRLGARLESLAPPLFYPFPVAGMPP